MSKLPKTVRIALVPHESLHALLTLRCAAGTDGWNFGAPLERAVEHAWRAATERQEALALAIRWLENAGMARVARARGRGGVRPGYCFPVQMLVPVARSVRDLRGRSRASQHEAQRVLSALATVLACLQHGALVEVREVRLGSHPTSVARAAQRLQAILEGAGFRLTDAEPAPSVRPARESASRAQPRNGGAPRATEPRAKSVDERASHVGSPEPHRRRRRPAAAEGGFGGLPDDAQPESRSDTPRSDLGPRGITLDAEFFLEQARITTWPCGQTELERGRKHALARLHPDRVGESGTALFHRATRGYAELRKLATANVAPGEPVRTAAPDTVAHAQSPSSGAAPSRAASAPSTARGAEPEGAPESRGQPLRASARTPGANPQVRAAPEASARSNRRPDPSGATSVADARVGEWPPRPPPPAAPAATPAPAGSPTAFTAKPGPSATRRRRSPRPPLAHFGT